MMKKRRLVVGLLAIGLLALRAAPAQAAEDIKTPAEESRYSRYTQNGDIASFLSALDFASRRMTVTSAGRTLATEDFPAADIFLAVITDEGAASPDQLDRAKPTILVVASQHGNEQSAKEAALRLCRDLAAGGLSPLLKVLNFLVIPQANPYGNLFDRRENEQGLDLNRDHVKLESPEVRAIHRVFRTWMPEVTLDLHEKGDDYYRVSLGCVSNANISSRLEDFSRSVILADVEKSLEKDRVTFHEYLVTEEMGVNTAAGANLRREDLAGREELTRYSTTDLNDGRNSLGIYQTLSFIQECASRHDLATLEQRTRWQVLGVRSFSEAIAHHAADVLSLVRGLRAALVENAGKDGGVGEVALRMDYVRDESQPSLTLKKFEAVRSPVRGILKVDKKAGEPVLASDLAPSPWPREYKVETDIVKNWFPRVAVSLSVGRPLGYIIPAERRDVVECLLAHGVEVGVFTADASLEAEMYLAREVKPAPYDYLPPDKIDVEKKEQTIIVRRGDYFVSCRQPGANLIPCLLEPQSAYGFMRYRSFDLVPKAGNFCAISRLVRPAELPLVPYCPWGTTP
jgi:hypothetical protein